MELRSRAGRSAITAKPASRTRATVAIIFVLVIEAGIDHTVRDPSRYSVIPRSPSTSNVIPSLSTLKCHPERSEGSALVTLSSADVSLGAGSAKDLPSSHSLRADAPLGAGHATRNLPGP